MGILEELEKKVLANLDELEADANKLLENIEKLKEIVNTGNYNAGLGFELEEGLKHIRLC